MSTLNYLSSATWFLPIRIILSFLYGLVIWLRNLFYNLGIFKTIRVDARVISVGNISVGGSGKTILVQALIEYCLSQNKQPAMLSRGYGRRTKGLFLVADKTSIIGDPVSAGDEPFMVAKKYPGVPIVVSENRVLGAQYLIKTFNPDVIILDDGFQHRRLHRDLNLVIIDQARNKKNHLLPWGKLRETYSSIKRADLVLFSKAALQKKTENNLILNLEDVVHNHRGKNIVINSLSGDYGLFAGLGNPDYFFSSVQRQLGPSTASLAFPDHSQYSLELLEKIKGSPCDYWITTEKDFIKLDPQFCEENKVFYITVSTPLPPALLGKLKQNFNFWFN